MSYDYAKQKKSIFCQDGAERLVRIAQAIDAAIAETGAVKTMQVLGTGDSWQGMACVDFLVEHGFFKRLDAMARWQDDVLVR